MSRSSQSACPDLIVLYPGAGHLNVLAYRIGLRLKALLWRERVKCPAGVDPFADLPAVLGRHPLRLETATALLADPATGGFLLLPGPVKAQRDRVWIERQLGLALPYPPQELYWRTRPGSARLELFWLPKAWANSQAEVLAKLGLRLDEIYPRAGLLRQEAEKSTVQQPCLLQEADALHVFDQGLVQRSAPLPAEAEAAAQAQQLERLALGLNAASLRKVPGESEEALARRILDVWLDGSDAIHLPVGRWAGWPGGASWQPALTLSAACAAVVAMAAIGLSWQNAAMENTLEGLSRDQRKLAPVAQKFAEMERSVRSDRQYLEAAKVLDKSALPLEALNRVSAALPDKYWVQRMQFKGNALDLAGRGGGNDEVIRLFGKKGIAAVVSEQPAVSPGPAATDAFQIRLDVNKLPAGDGR
jgi:hypothetical protein